MKTIFYTALFGRHTDLKEFDTKGFQFFCFTDDQNLVSNTWTIIQQPSTPGGSPRMAAKWYKMNPDTLGLPLDADDITIWIDASIVVTDPTALAAACTEALDGRDIALFTHPDRADIYAEAEVSALMPKYAGEPLLAQVEAYRADGLPEHTLWAGGVIARRAPQPNSALLGASWYFQCRRWSTQDQISLPYILWKLGIEPGAIHGSVYATDFHRHEWTGAIDTNARKKPTLVIIDDFLSDPDAARALALQQTYAKQGSAGLRSTVQFHQLVDHSKFSTSLDIRIDDWNRYSINGRFQICTSEDPIVYHADKQRYAGVLFLTPDAPIESGLKLLRSRVTGVRRSPQDEAAASSTFDGNLLDGTKWETIDTVGNIYNRLVLWDAQLIHAAGSYFGTGLDNGRLFWMFFFDGA